MKGIRLGKFRKSIGTISVRSSSGVLFLFAVSLSPGSVMLSRWGMKLSPERNEFRLGNVYGASWIPFIG